MALPWDSTTGAYSSGAGMANPVQNPLMPSQDQAVLNAMAEARAKRARLEQMIHMANVLKDEPLNARGAGPMGVRQGVGPMGWAVTLADAVAGAIAKKKREQAAQGVTGAMGPLSEAEQKYVHEYLTTPDPSEVPRYGRSPMSYVPQGSVLSLDPLALK